MRCRRTNGLEFRDNNAGVHLLSPSMQALAYTPSFVRVSVVSRLRMISWHMICARHSPR